ncbi:MAG: HEPN domain-containing protein [Firmicutes bacterium]|nr:HEPN domain-containing protein [Bacillota bacterium]
MKKSKKKNIAHYEQLCKDIANCGSLDYPTNYNFNEYNTYSCSDGTLYVKDKATFYYKSLDLFEVFSNETVSIEWLEKLRNKLIITNNFSFESFKNEIKETPVQKFTYMQKLFGITLPNDDNIVLGNFTIYNENTGRTLLQEKMKKNEFIENETSNLIGGQCCYLEIQTEAKDEKFVEKWSEKRILHFSRILEFIIGFSRSNNCIATIAQYGQSKVSYGFREEGILGNYFMAMSIENRSVNSIPIDKKFQTFLQEDGFNKIFVIDAKKNKNELEKRIIESIIWIGMALTEKDNAIAVLECMFAVECLLKVSSEIISKSIASQLAEYCAFLYSNDYFERKDAEKMLKELFIARSTVAHGRKKEFSNRQVASNISFVRTIILQVLIKDFQSIEEITQFVEKKRYA